MGFQAMDPWCIFNLLLLLGVMGTTVDGLNCFTCPGGRVCRRSGTTCNGPEAYCQTRVLRASAYYLSSRTIYKSCVVGQKPDQVTQLMANPIVRLSLQESYCNTNYCNDETDFVPRPKEPNDLRCYGGICEGEECTSSSMDSLQCLGQQSQCVDLTITGKMGITMDLSMRGCAQIPECVESLGFASAHASFFMHCCDSDFCNGYTVPNEDDLVPNGAECYSCREGDEAKGCPVESATKIKCSGPMTSCLEAYVVTTDGAVASRRVIRGCATPETCNGSFLTLIQQFQDLKMFCCSGHLCNNHEFMGKHTPGQVAYSNTLLGGSYQDSSSHGSSSVTNPKDNSNANLNSMSSSTPKNNSTLTLLDMISISAATLRSPHSTGPSSVGDKTNVSHSGISSANATSFMGSHTVIDHSGIPTSNQSSAVTKNESIYNDLTGWPTVEHGNASNSGIALGGHYSNPSNSSTVYYNGSDHHGNSFPIPHSDMSLTKHNVSDSNSSSLIPSSGVVHSAIASVNQSNVTHLGMAPGGINGSVYNNSLTSIHTNTTYTGIASAVDHSNASYLGISSEVNNNSLSHSISSVNPEGTAHTALSLVNRSSTTPSEMSSSGQNISVVSTVSSSGSSTSFSSRTTFTTVSSVNHATTSNSGIWVGGRNVSVPSNNSIIYGNSSDHTAITSSSNHNIMLSPGMSSGDHNGSMSNSTSIDFLSNLHHTGVTSGNQSSALYSGPLSGGTNSAYNGTSNNTGHGSSLDYHSVDDHTNHSIGNQSSPSHLGITLGGSNYSIGNAPSPGYHSVSYSVSTTTSGPHSITTHAGMSSVVHDDSMSNASSILYHSEHGDTSLHNSASTLGMPLGGSNHSTCNNSSPVYPGGHSHNDNSSSALYDSDSNHTGIATSAYGGASNHSSSSGNHNGTSYLGMPTGGHYDSVYSTPSNHTSDHSSASNLGISNEGHNHSSYNNSTTVYAGGSIHTDNYSSEHPSNSTHLGLFKDVYNNSLPNTSSTLYNSGSNHTGSASGGYSSVSNNTSSSGNHSGTSDLGKPSGDHGNSIFNTSSSYTTEHSTTWNPAMPSDSNSSAYNNPSMVYTGGNNHNSTSSFGNHSDTSHPGLSTDGYNNSTTNMSSTLYHSGPGNTSDHSFASNIGIPQGGSNHSTYNNNSSVYPGEHILTDNSSSTLHNTESNYTSVGIGDYSSASNYSSSPGNHSGTSYLGVPSGSHGNSIVNTSSNNTSDHNSIWNSTMPSSSINGSTYNNSSTAFPSGYKHNGTSTSGNQSGTSHPGMSSAGYNDSVSNTSSTFYHSNSTNSGFSTGDHISENAGISPGNNSYSVSNDSSTVFHSAHDDTGNSTTGHNSGSAHSGMSSGGSNESISNGSSSVYNNASDYTGHSTGDHGDVHASGMPLGNNSFISNSSSTISHPGPNHNAISSTDANSSVSHTAMNSTGNNSSLSSSSAAVYHSVPNHTGISSISNDSSSNNISASPTGESSNNVLTDNSATMNNSGHGNASNSATGGLSHGSSTGISHSENVHSNLSDYGLTNETALSSSSHNAVNADYFFRTSENQTSSTSTVSNYEAAGDMNRPSSNRVGLNAVVNVRLLLAAAILCLSR